MSIEYCSTNQRCNFEGDLTSSDFEDLRNNATLHTLQTDKPITPKNWELLESELFSIRKDVALRVYGFYGQECNISNIASIPSIRHFYADCLQSCIGLETLKELKNLSTLSVGKKI